MVYKKSKVLFDFLIDMLSLSIGLGIICHRQVSDNSCELVKILHELSCELGTAITDDLSRESMLTPHMVSVNMSGSLSRQFHVRWDDYDHL